MVIARWKKQALTPLIGLDISTNWAKCLKLNLDVTPHEIENFSIIPLPKDVITKDGIKDSEAISGQLKELIKKARVNSKDVAVSISRAAVITKTIQIDNRLSADDIESRAWIEANQHFPDLIGEIYLDFDVLGPSVIDPNQNDLLLVACRKDQVDPYLTVLSQVGLNAKIVDVNCYALQRALAMIEQPSTPLETVALLNLNCTLSTFIVMHQGQLIYAHDHDYDGQRLMTEARAHLAKQAVTALGEDAIYYDLLQRDLTTHLRHIMHLFYSSRPHITIQELVLTGDCATLPHIAGVVQQEISIDTRVANPFKNMHFKSRVDQDLLFENAPAMMLCYGLALSKRTV